MGTSWGSGNARLRDPDGVHLTLLADLDLPEASPLKRASRNRLALLEVLEADHEELHRRLVDAGRWDGMVAPRGSACG